MCDVELWTHDLHDCLQITSTASAPVLIEDNSKTKTTLHLPYTLQIQLFV